MNVAAGSSYGGKSVVITGSGFTGATAVKFGGLPVRSGQFTVNSDTQLTVSATPSNYGAVATVDVSVTAPSGTGAKASAYSYVAPTAPTTWDGNYPLRSTPSGWEGSVDAYGGAVPISATVNGSNQLVFTLHRRTDNGSACYY